MAITDDGAVEKDFVGPSCVEHGLISVGTLRNGAIVQNNLANLYCIANAPLWGLISMVWHAAPRGPGGDHRHQREVVVASPSQERHAGRHAVGGGSLSPRACQRRYPSAVTSKVVGNVLSYLV
jgi:hypothetical protein